MSTSTSPSLILFGFDGGDGIGLGQEHLGGTALAIDAIGIHHRRINRRRLYYRTFRRQIATREANSGSESAFVRVGRSENHIVRIDAVQCLAT